MLSIRDVGQAMKEAMDSCQANKQRAKNTASVYEPRFFTFSRNERRKQSPEKNAAWTAVHDCYSPLAKIADTFLGSDSREKATRELETAYNVARERISGIDTEKPELQSALDDIDKSAEPLQGMAFTYGYLQSFRGRGAKIPAKALSAGREWHNVCTTVVSPGTARHAQAYMYQDSRHQPGKCSSS
jgi:hypothetical protein